MGSPFQDLMHAQRSVPNVNNMGDQGLSPPYSNQSPPHSVQSNIALSPQAYIGKSGVINFSSLIIICSILESFIMVLSSMSIWS